MLDAADGRLLGRAKLACWAAGSHPMPHPDGKHVGLSVGEGQDGSELYWGHWEEDHPVVARLDDRSRVLVDVRSDGSHYLTTPHSSDGVVRVHRFPEGRTVAELDASTALPQDDWFDFRAGYVTHDLVLVGSAENQVHLMLSADTLSVLGTIEYPDSVPKGSISPTGGGTWLTSDYVAGLHQVWRLAEEA